MDAGEKEQALKYIPKLADPRERAEVTTTIQILDLIVDSIIISLSVEMSKP